MILILHLIFMLDCVTPLGRPSSDFGLHSHWIRSGPHHLSDLYYLEFTSFLTPLQATLAASIVLEGSAFSSLCLEHSLPRGHHHSHTSRSVLKYFSFSVKISLSILCKLSPICPAFPTPLPALFFSLALTSSKPLCIYLLCVLFMSLSLSPPSPTL